MSSGAVLYPWRSFASASRHARPPCVTRMSETAQMIITIKACAKEGSRRYPQILNEHELTNADFLMEQIIKWAIVEYYSEA